MFRSFQNKRRSQAHMQPNETQSADPSDDPSNNVPKNALTALEEAEDLRTMLSDMKKSQELMMKEMDAKLARIHTQLRSLSGTPGSQVSSIPPSVGNVQPIGSNGFIWPPMDLAQSSRSDVVLIIGTTVTISWRLAFPIQSLSISLEPAYGFNDVNGWPRVPGSDPVEQWPMDFSAVFNFYVPPEEAKRTVNRMTTKWIVRKVGHEMPNDYWVRLKLHWTIKANDSRNGEVLSAAFRLRYDGSEPAPLVKRERLSPEECGVPDWTWST